MDAVIGTDDGETYQIELDETQVQALTGLMIGDEVDGSVLGLDGYTLEITGGSDTEGFPMRSSVEGTGRKKLLLKGGTGAQDLEDGERKRKSVRGNTVSGQIAQLNLTVVEAGDTAIDTHLGEGDSEGAPTDDAGDEDKEETADAAHGDEA